MRAENPRQSRIVSATHEPHHALVVAELLASVVSLSLLDGQAHQMLRRGLLDRVAI